ncbi:cell filamentation protein Fic [bacterium]|nr:cell filamentation protein Fic [bacterium]
MKADWKLDLLPVQRDLETKRVLKALPAARAALAELNGIASTIPNQTVFTSVQNNFLEQKKGAVM